MAREERTIRREGNLLVMDDPEYGQSTATIGDGGEPEAISKLHDELDSRASNIQPGETSAGLGTEGLPTKLKRIGSDIYESTLGKLEGKGTGLLDDIPEPDPAVKSKPTLSRFSPFQSQATSDTSTISEEPDLIAKGMSEQTLEQADPATSDPEILNQISESRKNVTRSQLPEGTSAYAEDDVVIDKGEVGLEPLPPLLEEVDPDAVSQLSKPKELDDEIVIGDEDVAHLDEQKSLIPEDFDSGPDQLLDERIVSPAQEQAQEELTPEVAPVEVTEPVTEPVIEKKSVEDLKTAEAELKKKAAVSKKKKAEVAKETNKVEEKKTLHPDIAHYNKDKFPVFKRGTESWDKWNDIWSRESEFGTSILNEDWQDKGEGKGTAWKYTNPLILDALKKGKDEFDWTGPDGVKRPYKIDPMPPKQNEINKRKKEIQKLPKIETAQIKEETGNYYVDPFTGFALNLDQLDKRIDRADVMEVAKTLPAADRAAYYYKNNIIDREDLDKMLEPTEKEALEMKIKNLEYDTASLGLLKANREASTWEDPRLKEERKRLEGFYNQAVSSKDYGGQYLWATKLGYSEKEMSTLVNNRKASELSSVKPNAKKAFSNKWGVELKAVVDKKYGLMKSMTSVMTGDGEFDFMGQKFTSRQGFFNGFGLKEYDELRELPNDELKAYLDGLPIREQKADGSTDYERMLEDPRRYETMVFNNAVHEGMTQLYPSGGPGTGYAGMLQDQMSLGSNQAAMTSLNKKLTEPDAKSLPKKSTLKTGKKKNTSIKTFMPEKPAKKPKDAPTAAEVRAKDAIKKTEEVTTNTLSKIKTGGIRSLFKDSNEPDSKDMKTAKFRTKRFIDRLGIPQSSTAAKIMRNATVAGQDAVEGLRGWLDKIVNKPQTKGQKALGALIKQRIGPASNLFDMSADDIKNFFSDPEVKKELGK